MEKQHFSLKELQNLTDKDVLLRKVREILPDPMEVRFSLEEIQALKVIAETEKLSAEYNHKDQEASRWQSVINDLVEMEKGMPYRRPLY